MNSYNLSRIWFAFSYVNPEVKPIHTALYFWIIERANSSTWKKVIDIQTEKSMECLGVTDWRTYKNAMQFLTDRGFIIWVERSKNQYTCNKVTLVENPYELDNSLNNAYALNAEAGVKAHAEAIAEAHAEAYVKALAEALQSYINLKTNKPLNLQTSKQEATPPPEGQPDLEEKIKKVERQIQKETEKAKIPKKATQAAPEIQFPFDSQNFREIWEMWKEHRVRIKKPYNSPESEQAALMGLANFNEEFSISLIQRSISNGWQGLTFDKTKQEFQNFIKTENGRYNQSNGGSYDVEEAVKLARLLATK